MATTGQDTRYRILRPLGSGGMGQVTLAEDTLLDRRVALKRLHVASDAPGIKRLRREALLGASLNHPNLIPVYDVWEEGDGDLCIVMEYIAGNTLRDLIRDSGPVPVPKALPILAAIAAAIDAVHRSGIVHRDVKPANILLGIEGQIKLADLGIATVDDGTRITTADKVVGSFSYMAPEQLEGARPEPAIDVYALAAVAFETLCGKKARPEQNPVALAHAIATRPPPDLRDCLTDAPAAAAAVLKRGMAADPSGRPRTAGELIRRLQAAFDEVRTESVAPVAAPAALGLAAGNRQSREPSRMVARGQSASVRPPVASTNRYRTRRWPASRVLGLGALAALVIAVLAVALLSTGTGSKRPGTGRRATASSRRHHGSARRSAGATTPASPASAQGASSATGSTGGATGADSPAGASTSSTPSGVVQSFYEDAARHDYAAAWALADSNLRNQLNGYASFSSQMSAVRSITFHRAQTLSGATLSSATVALNSTSVQSSRTQNCSGTARTVRTSNGTWLVDGVSISCSNA